MPDYSKCSGMILDEISASVSRIDAEQVQRLVKAIQGAGSVFLVGVGRTLLSLQAFCKRLNHLGLSAHCVGDLDEPAAAAGDLLIVGSASGESVCPVAIARKAAALGVRVAHIGSNANSPIRDIADVFVRIPVRSKLNLPDEMPSEQIMSSLFEQSLYVLCDAMALMIADARKVDAQELWRRHANLE